MRRPSEGAHCGGRGRPGSAVARPRLSGRGHPRRRPAGPAAVPPGRSYLAISPGAPNRDTYRTRLPGVVRRSADRASLDLSRDRGFLAQGVQRLLPSRSAGLRWWPCRAAAAGGRGRRQWLARCRSFPCRLRCRAGRAWPAVYLCRLSRRRA